MNTTTTDYGYLQHGAAPGPFRTERVHIQIQRLYIIFHGERITIQIEGV